MKTEQGAPSFGACCFQKGSFNSNQMIGYYNKSQPTPKPIYKTNRIVLGPDKLDETADSFISANEVYTNIIATQCPLLGFPAGFENTLEDVKTMIIEQNVSLWVSLAPVMLGNFTLADLEDMVARNNVNCNFFPLLLVREFEGSITANEGYWNMSYAVSGFVSEGSRRIQFRRPEDMQGWTEVAQRVEHIWYMRWKDFQLPPEQDEALVMALARHTAAAVESGRRVVVNCLSGRGRSGSFILLIAAVIERVESISQMVDVLVRMRRSRDGLVETPKQFRYVAGVLGLGDTSLCSDQCMALKLIGRPSMQPFIFGAFGFVLALSLVWIYWNFCLAYKWRITRIKKKSDTQVPKIVAEEYAPLLDAKLK